MHNNNRGGGRGGQRRYNNNRSGGGYRNNNSGNAYNEDGVNQHQLRNAANLRNKYLGMARDAAASGDRVLAENYLQHADHYVRLLGVQQERQRTSQPDSQDQQQPQDNSQRDENQSAPSQGNQRNSQDDDSSSNEAFGDHLPAFLYGRVVSDSGNNASRNNQADNEEAADQ